jgi:hypothetical protein
MELEARGSCMRWVPQQGARTAGTFPRGEHFDTGALQFSRAASAFCHAENRDVDATLSEQGQEPDEMALGSARSQRLGHHEETHGLSHSDDIQSHSRTDRERG